MNTYLWLPLVALMSLPLHADLDCTQFLNAAQREALARARPESESIELFSREVNGQTKIVALVGERKLHKVINTFAGRSLFNAFDRTGFDFREAGLNDRVLDYLAYKSAMAVLKVTRVAQATWERLTRSKAREAERMARFKQLMEDVGVTIAETPRTQPMAPEQLEQFRQLFGGDDTNDPFADQGEFTQRRNRRDLPAFLRTHLSIAVPNGFTIHRPANKLVDLERGHRPSLVERLRENPVSLIFAISTVPLISTLSMPEAAHLPMFWGTLGVMGYQAMASVLEPIRAQHWYQVLFPFQHPGERARNQVSIDNVTQALQDPAVSSLVILSEERRVPGMVGRLIAGGYKPLSAAE